jgi:hypothetical protein
MFKCKDIRLDRQYLHVELEDGRIISTPLNWYPALLPTTEKQRKNYRFIAGKTMIEWPDLDLHLDIEEMLNVNREEKAA